MNEDAAKQWCELVKHALTILKYGDGYQQFFDLWLRAVGDGPDEIRTLKGEMLIDTFVEMKIGHEQNVIEAKATFEAEVKRTRRR